MESPILNERITRFIGKGTFEVEKVSYGSETVWIDKANSKGFHGVLENVWNFHIGGYQVCEKWLKDRKGRKLSLDDIAHYQKIIVALSETIRIMAEIDKVIEQYGGWPGAFTTASIATKGVIPETTIEPVTQEMKPYANKVEKLEVPWSHETPSSEGSAPIDDYSKEELMVVIRRVFSDGQGRDREMAKHDISNELGFQRLGPKISEVLDSAIMTAVRRGILKNEREELSIHCRGIEDYARDFLKDQFLASLGRAWIEREDAIRDFARWLGYARTGPMLVETARSLINGLIREQRLENSGSMIRRS